MWNGSGFTRWRLLAVWVLLAVLSLFPYAAHAVPSFAEQTGQPCAACHVGAFGPQLTKFGRDFKLNGYVAGDGKSHGVPLAVTTQLSLTHTNNAQPGAAAPHFAANDNFAIDQASFYYAGRIAPGLAGSCRLPMTASPVSCTSIMPMCAMPMTANCSAKILFMVLPRTTARRCQTCGTQHRSGDFPIINRRWRRPRWRRR